MQKSVLKDAIYKLGILEDDVIKVPNSEGVDYYQYSNGVFTYLGASENDFIMSDDEVYSLISGDMCFEIIARGGSGLEDVDAQLERMNASIKLINIKIDKQCENAKKEKEERKQEEKKALICSGIFLTVISIIALVSAIIKAC
ncbi:MAG: hypothetical protein IJZ30_07470 [Alphaproteobacteria bacterium]|nr:hypothetical protein [Alphaproteobacteria bacterium]